MSLELSLYLINILENLGNLLSDLEFVAWIILILAICIKIVCWAERIDTDETPNIISTRVAVIAFIAVLIISTVSLVVPSPKTMYMILGINTSKEMLKTDIGEKAYKVLDKRLDEYLKEGR